MTESNLSRTNHFVSIVANIMKIIAAAVLIDSTFPIFTPIKNTLIIIWTNYMQTSISLPIVTVSIIRYYFGKKYAFSSTHEPEPEPESDSVDAPRAQ